MTTFTRDLFNNLDPKEVLAEADYTGSTAVVNGASIDMQFFYALLMFLTNVDVTAGTIEILVEDSDDNSTFAPVEDKFLIGTEAGSIIGTADTGKIAKIGYRGPKRYVRASIVTTGATATGAGLKAVLGGARHLPLDAQIS